MVGKAHDEEGTEDATRQEHDRELTRLEALVRLRRIEASCILAPPDSPSHDQCLVGDQTRLRVEWLYCLISWMSVS